MSNRITSGAKGMAGALMAIVMVGVVAVGALIGYQVAFGDDSGSGSRSTAVTAPPTIPVSLPASPTAPPSTAPMSAAPSESASPTESATESATPDTGPGSKTVVPELQAAADAATSGTNIALVALDARNGEIVAITESYTSVSGATPPGSTFKVLTSAMLLSKGLVTPGAMVPCPATSNVNGRVIGNMGGFSIPDATFRQDFARSCNTAFLDIRGKLGNNDLSAFATTYFGLNSKAWHVKNGLGTVDGTVPPAANENGRAEQLIGQGTVQMNTMTMASVVATAITGQFHQPVLERGMDVYTGTKALPSGVPSAIKQMMFDCARTGTAKGVFTGMNDVGAKTGTAESGGGTDGWMVAFRGNIAVAAYAPGGASGAKAAGPAVAQFLRAVPS